MSENREKPSRDALPRAGEISEIAIVWGLIIAIIVIAVAMMEGL
ncbi:MAG: hypothetical protein ABI728_15800 [Betaproteobacteria bacterium]